MDARQATQRGSREERLQLYRASHASLQDLWWKLTEALHEFNEHSNSETAAEDNAYRTFASTLEEIFPCSLAPSEHGNQQSDTLPLTVEHAIAISIHALCVMGSHLDNEESSSLNTSTSTGTKRVPASDATTSGLGFTCTGGGEANELMPSLPSQRQDRNSKSVRQESAYTQGSSSKVVIFMKEYGKFLPPPRFELGKHTYAATYELNREAANIKFKLVRPAMANYLMMHVSVNQSSAVQQSVRSLQVCPLTWDLSTSMASIERSELLDVDTLQQVGDNLNVNSQGEHQAGSVYRTEVDASSGRVHFTEPPLPLHYGEANTAGDGGGLEVGPSNPCFRRPWEQPPSSLRAPPQSRYDPMTPWDVDRRGFGDDVDIDRPRFPHGGDDII